MDQISCPFLSFSTVAKNETVVERLFWQLGKPFSGRYRCTEVAVVERFKKESTYGLSIRTKKVAVVKRWPLVEVPISQERKHISLGICVFQVGEHISLGICVFQVGKHI